MLFNSLEYAVFLPAVLMLYWFLKRNLRLQNILLLTASYFFYGWWDIRFLGLLIFISLANYFIAIRLEKSISAFNRKLWLISGLILDIGILGYFKYFGFFVNSFILLVHNLGYNIHISSVKVILPLGISFYTFLIISYLLDVYKQKLMASRNPLDLLLTFGFFPIILAGPIQRPALLLPQITARRDFDLNRFIDGLRQILWGLFAKVVIADNLAVYTDDIFSNFSTYKGSVLLIGAVFYSIQIYADFSGYSNIAIGSAKLLGFRLVRNFANPYFARDIAEFWKRWHISLTTWFRDYVFLPVSFSISWKIKSNTVLFIKSDLFIYIIASLMTWFLTGLWHGANYTFIIWGMMHGLLLISYRSQLKPRKKLLKKLAINSNSRILMFVEFIITMWCIVITWIFFRADSVKDAINYLTIMFSGSVFSTPEFNFSRKIMLIIFLITVGFFGAEFLGRKEEYALSSIGAKLSLIPRWALYYFLGLIIFFFSGSSQQFIYFQF